MAKERRQSGASLGSQAGDEAMVAQDRRTRALTTGNTRRSCRSYLGVPGSRRRWQRGRWSWGPCPCGRWPGWSRSGARRSRRGSGTGRRWGTGPRRCHSCRAARRMPYTHTAGPRRSPGSCVLQGSCTHQGTTGLLDWETTATTGSTEEFKTHFGDAFCTVSEAATGKKLYEIMTGLSLSWGSHGMSSKTSEPYVWGFQNSTAFCKIILVRTSWVLQFWLVRTSCAMFLEFPELQNSICVDSGSVCKY